MFTLFFLIIIICHLLKYKYLAVLKFIFPLSVLCLSISFSTNLFLPPTTLQKMSALSSFYRENILVMLCFKNLKETYSSS